MTVRQEPLDEIRGQSRQSRRNSTAPSEARMLARACWPRDAEMQELHTVDPFAAEVGDTELIFCAADVTVAVTSKFSGSCPQITHSRCLQAKVECAFCTPETEET